MCFSAFYDRKNFSEVETRHDANSFDQRSQPSNSYPVNLIKMCPKKYLFQYRINKAVLGETEGIKGASLQFLESLGWGKGGDRSIRSNHLFIDLLVCAVSRR